MTSFAKPNKMHGRYDQLSPPHILHQLEEDDDQKQDGSQKYATFIKSLTSNFDENSSKMQKHKTSPKRSHTPQSVNKQQQSSKQQINKQQHPSKQPMKSTQPSLQTLNQMKIKNEENHKKKMKSIEDFMWQCKQEERELKRMEGDIHKKERSLMKTMKDYENDIYSKQVEEEAILNSTRDEEEHLKQQHNKNIDNITKEKINRNIQQLQKVKENENKAINSLSSLDFRYETVASAIHLKRNEVNQLVKDFEAKLKQKEEEEFRLKKEFADITFEIKTEAQKKNIQTAADQNGKMRQDEKDKYDELKRTMMFRDQIKNHTDRVKYAERSKRKMSGELQTMTGKISTQQREDGRKLMDLKSKLETNAHHQKEAQIKSELLQMEQQAVKSDEKIYTVNARRKAIHDMITEQLRERNEATMSKWLERHVVVHHETKKHHLKDNIGHFEKMVAKHDEVETTLYNQIRHLESDRRQKEQVVSNLRQQLLDTQRQNKELLKKTALHCQQEEMTLEQRLQREIAQLSKSLSEREEKIQSLAKYRNASKEDKHMLEEEQKVHDRLLRIEKKNNMLVSH